MKVEILIIKRCLRALILQVPLSLEDKVTATVVP